MDVSTPRIFIDLESRYARVEFISDVRTAVQNVVYSMRGMWYTVDRFKKYFIIIEIAHYTAYYIDINIEFRRKTKNYIYLYFLFFVRNALVSYSRK